MKTLAGLNLKKSLRNAIVLVFITVFFSSCYHDDPYYRPVNGLPGDAFLSLTWEYDIPDYLDVGTADIPAYFKWGRYYLVRPGFYTCYYEGIFWDYTHYATYAWEVDYEIWINLGTSSTPYRPAYNGADNFFTLELNPYGPFMYDPYRSAMAEEPNFEVLNETADEIVILKTEEAYSMKVTYKKKEAKFIDVEKLKEEKLAKEKE